MFDLADLKAINQITSPKEGDRVIMNYAQGFQMFRVGDVVARPGDNDENVVARHGGDEFVVALIINCPDYANNKNISPLITRILETCNKLHQETIKKYQKLIQDKEKENPKLVYKALRITDNTKPDEIAKRISKVGAVYGGVVVSSIDDILQLFKLEQLPNDLETFSRLWNERIEPLLGDALNAAKEIQTPNSRIAVCDLSGQILSTHQ